MDNYTYGVNGTMPSRHHTCMDFATVSEFLRKILDGTVTNFSLASFFQQDSDYITGIQFFPIDVAKFIDGSVTANNVIIGRELAPTTNPVKQVVNWKNYIQIFSLTITRTFNNFLDFEPYTRMKLSIPYFGFVDIPTEYAYSGTLDGYVAVDFSSGKATLYIYLSNTLVKDGSAVHRRADGENQRRRAGKEQSPPWDSGRHQRWYHRVGCVRRQPFDNRRRHSEGRSGRDQRLQR